MLGWSDWLLTIPLCEEVIMGFSANINLLDNGTVVKVFKDNISLALYKKLGYKKIKDDGSAIILEKKLEQ